MTDQLILQRLIDQDNYDNPHHIDSQRFFSEESPPQISHLQRDMIDKQKQLQRDQGYFFDNKRTLCYFPSELMSSQDSYIITEPLNQRISSNPQLSSGPQVLKDSDHLSSCFSECHDLLSGNYERKKKKKKHQKNQYDKNITANICSTVIRKMILPANKKEVSFYCDYFQVDYKRFIGEFQTLMSKNGRFGTSQLYSFFRCSEKTGKQGVFGLFMIRFLNEDYLTYMLSVGKMTDQRKYLECATNLMYIPKLSLQQTSLISQFHNMV